MRIASGSIAVAMLSRVFVLPERRAPALRGLGRNGRLLRFAQVLDPDVAEGDFGAVTAEADATCFSLQAGVFLLVERPVLRRFVEVRIDDDDAVEGDRDVPVLQ